MKSAKGIAKCPTYCKRKRVFLYRFIEAKKHILVKHNKPRQKSTMKKKSLWISNGHYITRWWFQPIWKVLANWESSPSRGENTKYLKPPPSHCIIYKWLRCEVLLLQLLHVLSLSFVFIQQKYKKLIWEAGTFFHPSSPELLKALAGAFAEKCGSSLYLGYFVCQGRKLLNGEWSSHLQQGSLIMNI